jgi:5-formyltetrahydrofolate cyclo-ligase
MPFAVPEPPCAKGWSEVRLWRRQVRDELIRHRLGLGHKLRHAQAEQAKQRLREHADLRKYESIGMYWPIRGEIDVRDLADEHVSAGGRVALPVIVTPGAPVEFWRWQPGAPLRPGVWNIPVPEERDLLIPDALIIPLVGFDRSGFRLGYGGGYYDRTIAAAARRPVCIGLGYASGALPSICPQPHDIPMDVIVTDVEVFAAIAAGLLAH